MVYLTLDDILSVRDQVAEAHADRFEVMSANGLLSALAAPRRSAFGDELFPTLPAKAGALVYALVQNHPFWDGNKRIASAALRLFLARNLAVLAASERELQQCTSSIARGRLRAEALAEWMADHIEDHA